MDTRARPTLDVHTERIAALEEKLASYDVRITCLEQMLVETDSDEFEQFYKKYPHKKAPRDAAKAFKAARKRASFEDIMAGLVNYIKHKPSDQKYAYPASWLNADRWLDTYDGVSEAPGEPEAPNPDRVARDRLTEYLGDRRKAAMLYNSFMTARDRVKLFQAAFDGNQGCRHAIDEACERMGYGPIQWSR